MKKIAALILALSMIFVMCGCASSDYKKAVALYNEKNYEAAKESFIALGSFENSEEFVASCDANINYAKAIALFEAGSYVEAAEIFEGLGEFKDSAGRAVDCEFLIDIEASIINRRAQNAKNTDYTTLTNTELSYVGKYESAAFHDASLKKYAKAYIKGLNDQKDALKIPTYKSEHQIAWSSGKLERMEVLSGLYHDFGLLKDDHEFIATYVSDLDHQRNYVEALKAIDKDLHEQLDDIGFDYVDRYYFSATYKNNTKYDFDLTFQFTFYNVDSKLLTEDATIESLISQGTRLDDSTNYSDAIKSGSTTILKFYQPVSNWTICEFFWTISDITE